MTFGKSGAVQSRSGWLDAAGEAGEQRGLGARRGEGDTHAARCLGDVRGDFEQPRPQAKANRKEPRSYDKDLYKARSLIEIFFCKLKQFRAIATRYDKTARNFLAATNLAAAVIWLN